jgi:hypothetical protein
VHGTNTVGREQACLKHVYGTSAHGTGVKSGEQACMDQVVCAVQETRLHGTIDVQRRTST